MRKYLLGSIKKPGSLWYYESAAEQDAARERFKELQVIRKHQPTLPVPVWPLPEALSPAPAATLNQTRISSEAPGEGSGIGGVCPFPPSNAVEIITG